MPATPARAHLKRSGSADVTSLPFENLTTSAEQYADRDRLHRSMHLARAIQNVRHGDSTG